MHKSFSNVSMNSTAVINMGKDEGIEDIKFCSCKSTQSTILSFSTFNLKVCSHLIENINPRMKLVAWYS